MTQINTRPLFADKSGVTIVEFALLLVPLCAVILGFLELGYQSYVRSMLQGALNEVARTASVENPRIGDANLPLETRVENRVKERMSVLTRSGTYQFRLSNYQSFTGVGKPEVLVTDVNGNGRYDQGDCWQDTNPNGAFDLDAGRSGIGGADDVVFYEVLLTLPHLLPVENFVGGPNEFTVDARTAVRSQPYAGQRQTEVVC